MAWSSRVFCQALSGLLLGALSCSEPAPRDGTPSFQRALAPSLAQSMPLGQCVGLSRAVNESLLGARPDSRDDGWVLYDSFALRYDHGCAVEFAARMRTPAACEDAVQVLGLKSPTQQPGPPDTCLFTSTGDSRSPALAASLSLKTGALRARLADPSKCGAAPAEPPTPPTPPQIVLPPAT